MTRSSHTRIELHRIHLPAFSSFASGAKWRSFTPRRSDHPTVPVAHFVSGIHISNRRGIYPFNLSGHATHAKGMESWPGVMAATECFAALKAGATGLKIFHGSLLAPDGLKAIRASRPAER